MSQNLTTQLINENDSGSVRAISGTRSVRTSNSDQQEPFTIKPLKEDSQKTGPNQNSDSLQKLSGKKKDSIQTNVNENENKNNSYASNATPIQFLAQINPMAETVNSTTDPKIKNQDTLFVSNSENSLIGTSLKIKGENESSFVQNAAVTIPDVSLTELGDKIEIENQDNKKPVSFNLNEGNGKPVSISATNGPGEMKEASLLDKFISDLPSQNSPEGKSGDGKEGSGNSTPEGSFSGQNGSAGTFLLGTTDKLQEKAANQSYSPVPQSEGTLYGSSLSTRDLSSEQKQILQQLTGYLASSARNDLQSVRINLSPETLGTIQIDISVQNQQVKADIVASTEQVKGLLESHQALLRNGLADNGLRVDQFTVRLEESASYQSSGHMNLHNHFFQGESQSQSHFYKNQDVAAAVIPYSAPDNGTGGVTKKIQDGISLYI
ncbi:MAG: flagellar hook-length control protein FliK [Nitrospiria bacterium]